MNRGGLGRPGGGGSPQEWFYSLPPITRSFFVAMLATTCFCSFGMISPTSLHLNYNLISSKFEVWRLASNLVFLGTFSFPFLLSLYIFIQYSNRYEVGPFDTGAGGTSADYAWMLSIATILLSVAGFVMREPFMGQALSFTIMYVWSKKNPESMTSIFGFNFKALYLPLALIAFHMLIGNPLTQPIIGVITGHIYYFLHYIAPAQVGFEIIKTPRFIIEWFGGAPVPVMGSGRPHPGAAPARPYAGHSWGAGGQVLGRS